MGFNNVTAQVRHEDYEALRAVANEKRIPISEAIRQALSLWLASQGGK